MSVIERHLFSFVLLVLSVIRNSFRKRKWLWSPSSAPCEKELNTPVGWLLSLSHKYTIWALVSFQIPFFVIHCCPQVPLLTLTCLWLYIPHTYSLTQKLLSVAGLFFTNINYSLSYWKGSMYLQVPITILCSCQQHFCILFCLVGNTFIKTKTSLRYTWR